MAYNRLTRERGAFPVNAIPLCYACIDLWSRKWYFGHRKWCFGDKGILSRKAHVITKNENTQSNRLLGPSPISKWCSIQGNLALESSCKAALGPICMAKMTEQYITALGVSLFPQSSHVPQDGTPKTIQIYVLNQLASGLVFWFYGNSVVELGLKTVSLGWFWDRIMRLVPHQNSNQVVLQS